MPAQRPVPSPQVTADDLWPHLRELVAPEVLPPDMWDRLEPLLPAIPGPVLGFEREFDDPALTEIGLPLPRHHAGVALEAADRHPAAAHMRPFVRAWLDTPGLADLCDLQMYTWDVDADAVGAPCVFLRAARGGDWREMLRSYATALHSLPDQPVGPTSSHEVAERLLDAEASTPAEGVLSVGVYLGRAGAPVRLTASVAARPWPDHPAWAQVDDVLTAARREPHPAIVAFAAGADPGDAWHVPVMLDRMPKPGEAALPLLGELVRRGLATQQQAEAAASVDVRLPLHLDSGTLGGVPATATLWWSLERIKVVVRPQGWHSAKVYMLARVIWRGVDGTVLVDH